MDELETLIVPALLAGAAAAAWLALTARHAALGRALVEAAGKAVALRRRQEALVAAGKPAPYLAYARRAEDELRALARRRGFSAPGL